ncbi:MAG: carboxypeptidase regulatory-like domain-containing protein [Zoogloeaceae bacterium]|nr:carboxypeptidase regulatory-like domain-containing protein [Zoogloeaceae bacterium]
MPRPPTWATTPSIGRGCGRTDRLLHAERRADRDQRRWGFYEKAEIGDRVWLDANKNGIQDAGEAGVSGVTARLVDADGNVVATATTDANGNYLFDGLTPGQYRVDFDLGTLPAGFAVTTRTPRQHRHERLGCQPGHGRDHLHDARVGRERPVVGHGHRRHTGTHR